MPNLTNFVLIAVNIVLAAYYLSGLRRLRQREKELLEAWKEFNALKHAEAKALTVCLQGDEPIATTTQSAQMIIRVGRN